MIKEVMGVDIAGFHQEWISRYLREKSTYISCSRRHIKSTISQLIAAWEVERKKTRIIVAMNSLPQTKDWVRNFVQLFEYYVKQIQSDVEILTYNSVEITLSNGSIIYIRSLTGKFRGLNPDVIILDDLLDEKQNLSFAEAEMIIRRVILASRLPHTRTLYVGTILREGDALDKLRRHEFGNFVGDNYPAIPEEDWHLIDDWHRWYAKAREKYAELVMLEDKDAPKLEDWYEEYRYTTNTEPPRPRALWPEKYPLETLIEWREDLGNYAFQVEFLLNPLSDELALVPKRLMDQCKDTSLILRRPNLADTLTVAGMDLQASPSSDADWTVILSLELVQNKYRILDMVRFRGRRYDAQMLALNSLHQRYNFQVAKIEKNFESFLIQILEDQYPNLPVEAHTTSGSNKHDMQTGIPSVRGIFETRKVVIPWGDPKIHSAADVDYTRRMMSILIQETAAWQYDSAKGKFVSKGRHDDTTMAFWFAVLAARDAESGRARFITVDLS